MPDNEFRLHLDPKDALRRPEDVIPGGVDAPSRELWGFADLHTHPASHLAFGAETEGAFEFGIFWGKPGLSWDRVDLAADLPPCDADTHTVIDDGGPTRIEVRRAVLAAIAGFTPDHPHERDGCCSFGGWPHARSLMHQQMHISWIRRAWQGGLRLMIASVTDNQVMAMLWHRTQNKPETPFDPNKDYQSARTQLAFIRDLVTANSSWMEIVTTSSQARTAISNNRLAIILSLEMDTLTLEQILTLKDEFGVRHVTPIHLANNSFGGAAVYSDLFNTNNHYLNQGEFYQVIADPNLAFKLGRPNYLRYISGNPLSGGDLIKGGVYEPTPIGDNEYRALNYPTDAGHKNARSLDQSRLDILMQHSFLIDLAHMSESAQEDAIAMAERFRYPMMDSHTGLRPDDGRPARDERAMKVGHARRLGLLGGMIGLGTSREDYPVGDPVQTWIHEYMDAAELMGNRRVALGTDMNGLAPQIPFSRARVAITYPISLARKIAHTLKNVGITPTDSLDRLRVGDRTFDFAADGLAHYGMLPDFLQAVHNVLSNDGREADRLVGQLYRTAEDVVQMWERVEAAATMMRPNPIALRGRADSWPEWTLLDRNPATRQIVAAGGSLYQVHSDGKIWRHTGVPLTGWELLGQGPASATIAAGGSHLYRLHEDGTIWRFTGTPLTDWQRLDNNHAPGARQIVADGENLYQLHRDGKIYQYTNNPTRRWLLLDDNPATSHIVNAGGNLYQLHSDGKIWRYTGVPMRGWQLLDDNSATRQVAAAAGNLYQLHSDGKIWRYTGMPMRGWELLDQNPATTQIVADAGELYQMHRDRKIWRYKGIPLTGWEALDRNPATRQLVADMGAIYQLHSDGKIWSLKRITDEEIVSALTRSGFNLFQSAPG